MTSTTGGSDHNNIYDNIVKREQLREAKEAKEEGGTNPEHTTNAPPTAMATTRIKQEQQTQPLDLNDVTASDSEENETIGENDGGDTPTATALVVATPTTIVHKSGNQKVVDLNELTPNDDDDDDTDDDSEREKREPKRELKFIKSESSSSSSSSLWESLISASSGISSPSSLLANGVKKEETKTETKTEQLSNDDAEAYRRETTIDSLKLEPHFNGSDSHVNIRVNVDGINRAQVNSRDNVNNETEEEKCAPPLICHPSHSQETSFWLSSPVEDGGDSKCSSQESWHSPQFQCTKNEQYNDYGAKDLANLNPSPDIQPPFHQHDDWELTLVSSQEDASSTSSSYPPGVPRIHSYYATLTPEEREKEKKRKRNLKSRRNRKNKKNKKQKVEAGGGEEGTSQKDDQS